MFDVNTQFQASLFLDDTKPLPHTLVGNVAISCKGQKAIDGICVLPPVENGTGRFTLITIQCKRTGAEEKSHSIVEGDINSANTAMEFKLKQPYDHFHVLITNKTMPKSKSPVLPSHLILYNDQNIAQFLAGIFSSIPDMD